MTEKKNAPCVPVLVRVIEPRATNTILIERFHRSKHGTEFVCVVDALIDMDVGNQRRDEINVHRVVFWCRCRCWCRCIFWRGNGDGGRSRNALRYRRLGEPRLGAHDRVLQSDVFDKFYPAGSTRRGRWRRGWRTAIRARGWGFGHRFVGRNAGLGGGSSIEIDRVLQSRLGKQRLGDFKMRERKDITRPGVGGRGPSNLNLGILVGVS